MGFSGYIFVQGALLVFHFCTLEEYYIGGLFLPVGNGITDGSLIYFIMFLIPAFIGNSCYAKEAIKADYLFKSQPSLSVMNVFIGVIIVCQLLTFAKSVYNVFSHKSMIK